MKIEPLQRATNKQSASASTEQVIRIAPCYKPAASAAVPGLTVSSLGAAECPDRVRTLARIGEQMELPQLFGASAPNLVRVPVRILGLLRPSAVARGVRRKH